MYTCLLVDARLTNSTKSLIWIDSLMACRSNQNRGHFYVNSVDCYCMPLFGSWVISFLFFFLDFWSFFVITFLSFFCFLVIFFFFFFLDFWSFYGSTFMIEYVNHHMRNRINKNAKCINYE